MHRTPYRIPQRPCPAAMARLVVAGSLAVASASAQAQSGGPITSDVALTAVLSVPDVPPGDTSLLTLTVNVIQPPGQTYVYTNEFDLDLQLPLPLQAAAGGASTTGCGNLLAIAGHDSIKIRGGAMSAPQQTCSITVPIIWPQNAALMCGPEATLQLHIRRSQYLFSDDTANRAAPTIVELSCTTPYQAPPMQTGPTGPEGPPGPDGDAGALGGMGPPGPIGVAGTAATPDMCTAADAVPVPTLGSKALLLASTLLALCAAVALRRRRA